MAVNRASLVLVRGQTRTAAARSGDRRGHPVAMVAGRAARSSFPQDHPLVFWDYRDRVVGDGMSDRPPTEIVQHAAEKYGSIEPRRRNGPRDSSMAAIGAAPARTHRRPAQSPRSRHIRLVRHR
jgi:hypothetical protein